MRQRIISCLLLIGTLYGFFAACLLRAPLDVSITERRQLAQFPDLDMSGVLNGSFSTNFENYATDQFPFRERFRTLKALAQFYLFARRENNGVASVDGIEFSLSYPLNEYSVKNASSKMMEIYADYLSSGSVGVYLSMIPDKAFYLAEQNGYASLDYGAMVDILSGELPAAEYIDITSVLTIDCYYRTDSHWRQEALLPAAEALANALGVTIDSAGAYELHASDTPFYGVHYGQAALPVRPDQLRWLTSETLEHCSVYHYEDTRYATIYEPDKLTSRDPYDLFLSGASAIIQIDNPSCKNGRRLIIFRDSFGSSLAPLLVCAYEQLILIDTRYIKPSLLGDYVDFSGADVLFLYSAGILNDSVSLK